MTTLSYDRLWKQAKKQNVSCYYIKNTNFGFSRVAAFLTWDKDEADTKYKVKHISVKWQQQEETFPILLSKSSFTSSN